MSRQSIGRRFSGTVALIAALAFITAGGCGSEKGGSQMTPVYSARVETDSASGQPVIVLERSGAHPMSARIAPRSGANLFSLTYDGKELLYANSDLNQLPGYRFGTPVLYPAPNRVAKGVFSFEGRTFDWGVNEKDRFLHALVHSGPWENETPTATADKAEVLTWLDFVPGTPYYEKFGYDHRLNLRFSLDSLGIKIEYEVVNRDSLSIPFGFALHPYFNFIDDRNRILLCVPAKAHMQAVDLMPTGELESLDGSVYDLRTPTAVGMLSLDEVYYGMEPQSPAFIEYQDSGLKLILKSSADFTHMVVYAQPQNPFVCVENQTCSTDAHNLHARGLADVAHLLTAPPGEVFTGWVRYDIEPLSR